MIAPPAIIQQIDGFPVCECPECARLDARHPGEGVQLALVRYRVELRGVR